MNERIKELIEQATEVRQPAPHSNQTENSIVFNKEKFAELIVQECVRGINRDGWYWNSNSVEELCEKIEKHFGVE